MNAQTKETESENLQNIGRGAYESIAEMVAALECDYERLAELREISKGYDDKGYNENGVCQPVDERDELAELESAAGDCESREDAEQRIQDDPLSIELNGTWTLGETPVADRAYILLGTGGPATRIVCELDANMEPRRAWIQAQDWFQPWTDYIPRGDGTAIDTLLRYCACFYYGEG